MLIRHQDLLDVVGMAHQVDDHRAEVEADDIAEVAPAVEQEAENIAAEGDQVADQKVAARSGAGEG